MVQALFQGHGQVGRREQGFSRLLPKRMSPWSDGDLDTLAKAMILADPELNDGADAEENLMLPAGYTYFSQFVDHDLTFETTSNIDLHDPRATNLRTPRLDLDCLYGSGPDDQPYMYAADHVHLLPLEHDAKDLARVAQNGFALIGDKRNDENSIVCQLQLAFIKFHNRVVDKLAAEKGLAKAELFAAARDEVRWTYQRIVAEDLLARLVETTTYDFFMQQRSALGDGAYALYTPDKRHALPLEFAGAAYRFGHSMVRNGYRLNEGFKRRIFDATDDRTNSLVGFGPLPESHLIQWARFFPSDESLPPGAHPVKNEPEAEEDNPAMRLQWAYKLDPSLVGPLEKLPPAIAGLASLASLNLRRGNLFGVASGQAFAEVLDQPALDPLYLQTRQEGAGGFTFEPIPAALQAHTPLWFYILAEAQKPVLDLWKEKGADLVEADFMAGPGSVSQLGPVGGRIVLEVLNGLIDADADSFRSPRAQGWKPIIGPKMTMTALLKFTGLI